MNRRPTMVRQVKEYLQQRRSLGFGLESQGYLLLEFAKYLDRSGHRGPLTTELMLRWVNLPGKISRNYRARRLSAVRCFARYLAVRDGRTEVPGRQLIAKTSFHQRPHLYSQRELEELLAAAGRLWPTYPLKRLMFQTLFGLLACTGLRVSEALKLNAGHVDLDRGVLRIEKTKFKKSRLVPLHPTATRALRRYAQARYGQGPVCDDSAFFVGGNGNRLHLSRRMPRFFINYARCWVGKRATANGLVHGFTIFATASLAEGSCLGIAKARTFITLSPRSRLTWGTVMLPTPTGI